MKTFKWTEISWPSETERFEILSEYLNQLGFANEFSSLAVEPMGFDENLVRAQKEMHCVRIGSPYGEQVIEQFTHLPALMVTLRCCDALVCKNKIWWPENLLHTALQELLAQQERGLDLTSSVLIVGAGAAARSSVAAVLRLGFFKINITDQFAEKGANLVAELKRVYFNAQIQFVSQDSPNSLPGTHSLVINATPLRPDNHILTQLYYFNFMQVGGLVVDYTLAPLETPLMKEALDVGGRVVNGSEVASYVDQLWAKEVLGVEFEREAYLKHLQTRLSTLRVELPTVGEADV